MTLSVIILSRTIDDDIYRINCQCIDSLFQSEPWGHNLIDVIMIESCLKASYEYDTRVKIIKPNDSFNFHHYLNIGVNYSQGGLIAFCNNDIVFTPQWFSSILKVKHEHPEFMCFSPIDRNYPLMGEDSLPSTNDYYIGWVNKKHFAGWCFVWERKVFDIIGSFDERFSFYYADDDELQTLRYYAIPNVVVTHSEVRHLSQYVTKKESKSNSHKITDKEKYPLTKEEIRRGYSWLWDDERFYNGYQTMKAKWGNEKMRRRVDRLLEKYRFLNIRLISKFLYNKNINSILCILTGIKQ